jgi:hypothetical protein
LKTFLTQIGLALPLTMDSPIICFRNRIGWKDYEVPKITIWRAFLPKSPNFFSPASGVPALRTRRAHHARPHLQYAAIRSATVASLAFGISHRVAVSAWGDVEVGMRRRGFGLGLLTKAMLVCRLTSPFAVAVAATRLLSTPAPVASASIAARQGAPRRRQRAERGGEGRDASPRIRPRSANRSHAHAPARIPFAAAVAAARLLSTPMPAASSGSGGGWGTKRGTCSGSGCYNSSTRSGVRWWCYGGEQMRAAPCGSTSSIASSGSSASTAGTSTPSRYVARPPFLHHASSLRRSQWWLALDSNSAQATTAKSRRPGVFLLVYNSLSLSIGMHNLSTWQQYNSWILKIEFTGAEFMLFITSGISRFNGNSTWCLQTNFQRSQEVQVGQKKPMDVGVASV